MDVHVQTLQLSAMESTKYIFFTWFNVQVITKTDVEVQIDVLGFI